MWAKIAAAKQQRGGGNAAPAASARSNQESGTHHQQPLKEQKEDSKVQAKQLRSDQKQKPITKQKSKSKSLPKPATVDQDQRIVSSCISYCQQHLRLSRDEQIQCNNHWVPRGVTNRGNTCFLNSAVQGLFACRQLRDALQFLYELPNLDKSCPASYALASLYDEYHVDPSALCSTKCPVDKLESAPTERKQNGSSRHEVYASKSSRRRQRRKAKLLQQQQSEQSGSGTVDKKIHHEKQQEKRRLQSQLPLCPLQFDGFLKEFQRTAIGRHEDCHEFLLFLLDLAHRELAGSADSLTGTDVLTSSDDGWHEVGTKMKTRKVNAELGFKISPLSCIFGGSLRIVLHRHGHGDTVSFQPFYTLSLDIGSDLYTLEDTIQAQMNRKEEIDILSNGNNGNNNYATRIRAHHQCSIRTFPQVLICHLKRFGFQDNRIHKLGNPVYYPLHLDHWETDSSTMRYELVAVVCHHGKTASGGHYTTYVSSSSSNTKRVWTHIDDSKVSVVAEKTVLEQITTAYLLFYNQVPVQ